MQIEIIIREKIARTVDKHAFAVCGNSDYTVKFDFDSEWDSYETKTARFKYNGSYTDVPFSGDTCPMPVITNAYRVEIGVYAGELRTSSPALLPLRRSILDGNETESEPSQEIKDNLDKMLAGKIDKAQGVENAGMILGVDEDGNVVPGDPSYLPGFVSYSIPQGLTYEQQEHAKRNIGAGTLRHVYYWNANGTPEEPNGVMTCAVHGDTCICGGLSGLPDGMKAPVLVIYGSIDRGYRDATAFDGSNATWTFTVNLRDYSYSTPIKKSGVPMPTTAQVGQIVQVKAVDANGKITETEAVDMPSGGGKETWEIVADITLAENAAQILAEFEPCEKIKVILYIQSSAAGWMRIYPNTTTSPGGTDRAYIAMTNIATIPKATRILIDFGINKFISIENMYITTYSVAQRGDESFGNLEINAGDMYQKNITGRYAANLDGGVNKILVDGPANDGLGAGTRLTIYGVKI